MTRKKSNNNPTVNITFTGGDPKALGKAIERAYRDFLSPKPRRYARNLLRDIQEQAANQNDTTAQGVLDALNYACVMVTDGYSERHMANHLQHWSAVKVFMQTDVWSIFGYEASLASGYNLNNIMLLTSLIEAALDDHDDL